MGSLVKLNPLARLANPAIEGLYGRGLGADDTQTGASAGALSAGHTAEARAAENYAWATETGNANMREAQGISAQQRGIADMSNEQALDQWKRYQTTFAPIEDKMASDAMNYDSPEQMARVRQEAAGSANQAFDTAQRSRDIGLQHMGVNPNSGRFVDPNGAGTLNRTIATSDSMNRATAGRNDVAIGLRANAAGFGRNVAGAAAGLEGLSLGANTAAMNTLNTTAGNNSALRTNTNWMNSGIQGYNTAGGLSNQVYNTQMNQVNSRMASMDSFLGNLMPMGGMSDENVKEEKMDVDSDRVLEGLVKIPVKAWKYKDGVADSGRHVGPMAQEVHKQFGDRAAPGGKMIDFLSMHGLTLAGLQALARKVDRLSAGLELAGA